MGSKMVVVNGVQYEYVKHQSYQMQVLTDVRLFSANKCLAPIFSASGTLFP